MDELWLQNDTCFSLRALPFAFWACKAALGLGLKTQEKVCGPATSARVCKLERGKPGETPEHLRRCAAN
ncbi:hypothetical protein AOLI_G00148330 [Acnodon oligacanthus]